MNGRRMVESMVGKGMVVVVGNGGRECSLQVVGISPSSDPSFLPFTEWSNGINGRMDLHSNPVIPSLPCVVVR